jgi:hypothetical protein
VVVQGCSIFSSWAVKQNKGRCTSGAAPDKVALLARNSRPDSGTANRILLIAALPLTLEFLLVLGVFRWQRART